MLNRLNKFYGGVIPDPIKRYGYYPLDNAKILEVINPELLTGTGSAINEYDFLADFMKTLKPKPIDIIEIGTLLGVASALLASYCQTVFTFDIWYRNSHHIWNELEVWDRINCYTGNQKFIDDVINQLRCNTNLNINFAFIDGMHKIKNVIHDFEQVKFCKRVLFHDANIGGIGDFIKKIGGKFAGKDKMFGYWEDKVEKER